MEPAIKYHWLVRRKDTITETTPTNSNAIAQVLTGRFATEYPEIINEINAAISSSPVPGASKANIVIKNAIPRTTKATLVLRIKFIFRLFLVYHLSF